MTRAALVLAIITHLLTVAVSVYLASTSIVSILTSSWVCSGTGFVLVFLAGAERHVPMFLAGMSTPALAVLLFLVEAVVQLGPARAWLPFCIVFFVYQMLLLPWCLHALRSLISPIRRTAFNRQFGLRFLIGLTAALSVTFASVRVMVQGEFTWLSAIALFLFGITTVGVFVAIYLGVRDLRTGDDAEVTNSAGVSQ